MVIKFLLLSTWWTWGVSRFYQCLDLHRKNKYWNERHPDVSLAIYSLGLLTALLVLCCIIRSVGIFCAVIKWLLHPIQQAIPLCLTWRLGFTALHGHLGKFFVAVFHDQPKIRDQSMWHIMVDQSRGWDNDLRRGKNSKHHWPKSRLLMMLSTNRSE